MQLLPASPRHRPALPCALQQHPTYARSLGRLGAAAAWYRLHADGADLAWLQVIRRRICAAPVTWLARGPVWQRDIPFDLRRHALATLARDLPGVTLVSPETAEDGQAMKAAGLHQFVQARSVAEIDLTMPEAVRLARQDGKWRNRLRRAQDAGLDVIHRPLDPAGDAALLARELAQRKARRYAALPPAFTETWARVDPAAARLFLARRGGAPVAFMLVLLHPPAATYHVGWTGPAGRATSAHQLLLWQASNWLANEGFQRFDLGQADIENAPGLARFKTGSGAALRPLGPTFLALPRLFVRPAGRRHAA